MLIARASLMRQLSFDARRGGQRGRCWLPGPRLERVENMARRHCRDASAVIIPLRVVGHYARLR